MFCCVTYLPVSGVAASCLLYPVPFICASFPVHVFLSSRSMCILWHKNPRNYILCFSQVVVSLRFALSLFSPNCAVRVVSLVSTFPLVRALLIIFSSFFFFRFHIRMTMLFVRMSQNSQSHDHTLACNLKSSGKMKPSVFKSGPPRRPIETAAFPSHQDASVFILTHPYHQDDVPFLSLRSQCTDLDSNFIFDFQRCAFAFKQCVCPLVSPILLHPLTMYPTPSALTCCIYTLPLCSFT